MIYYLAKQPIFVICVRQIILKFIFYQMYFSLSPLSRSKLSRVSNSLAIDDHLLKYLHTVLMLIPVFDAVTDALILRSKYGRRIFCISNCSFTLGLPFPSRLFTIVANC